MILESKNNSELESGAFNGAIVRINGREEKTREEWTARWLKTFENLGISVDDSYEKSGRVKIMMKNMIFII